MIAGAGISGLYAALLLARAGRRVRLIERAPRAGGLAGAETFRGIPCDLGSHRLHAAALDHPLFREMHARSPFLTRPRRGVLVMDGRHIPYPPSALSMLRAIGPGAGAAMGLGLLVQRGRRAAFARWERDRARAGEDVGFERFVLDRVGAAAYASFYKPYAEKVWGIPPAELSQTVAKKRVSTTNPLALIDVVRRSVLAVPRRWLTGRAAAPDGVDHFIYPAGGTASIIGFLEDELAGLGVRAECGMPLWSDAARDAEGAEWRPGASRVERGCGAEGVGRHPGAATLHARGRSLAPPILYSGDLSSLLPDAPLEHRGLYLVYLAFPVDRLGAAETYYSPDPRFWFGRVSELQNYGPALRRPGETAICVEIPEGAWGHGHDFATGKRLESLLAQLVAAGITPRGLAPLEARQRFVPNVYPLYRRGWIGEWRRTMRRAAALGVLPFGRQALFLHCNLDHCAAIAADAVAHVQAGGDATTWVLAAERYLDLRVRD